MQESSQQVVCIAGMHRSGTSMIARLLNLCGMDLGAQADLMPASEANPEGYWEHVWFNYYNDQLLQFFSGAWDLVPLYPENWQETPGIEWVAREAAEVVAKFKGPIWGFKDPRTSITLPFWRKLIPGLRTVVCLRNPLDVANSLNKRGSSSPFFGLQLWWQYNSLLLLATSECERVVTHFDVYFRDGKSELQRVVNALGMQASEAAVEEACKASKASLRHSVTGLEALEKATPWKGIVETYCKLLVEAGEHCRAMTEDWGRVEEYAANWSPKSSCLIGSEFALDLYKKMGLQQQQAHAAEIAAMEQRHADAMTELQQQLERITAAVAQVAGQRDTILHRHDELLAENMAIRNSKTWKAMTKLGAVAMKTGLVKPADHS